MSKEPDEILTVPEVAAYLRLSEATVYRLARSGEAPARRIGRSWRFSRAAIQQWLWGKDNNSSQPTGEKTR